MKGARALPPNDGTKRVKTVLAYGLDRPTAEALRVNLEHANLQLEVAQSAAQTLTKALDMKPDIIILNGRLRDTESLDVCRTIKEIPETKQIPVIVIDANMNDQQVAMLMGAGADDVCVHQDPSRVVDLLEAKFQLMEQKKMVRQRSKLPSMVAINRRIDGLVKENRRFAILYIDVLSMQGFIDANGPSGQDSVISLTAQIMSSAVQLFGNADDVIGHLENESFAIITSPAKAEVLCKRIISDFDQQIQILWPGSGKRRCQAENERSREQLDESSRMRISIAVVTNEMPRINSHLQAEYIGDQLREYVMRLPGSNYCFDRRQNVMVMQSKAGKRELPEFYHYVRPIQAELSLVSFLTTALLPLISSTDRCLHKFIKSAVDESDPRQISRLKLIDSRIQPVQRILRQLDSYGSLDLGSKQASPIVVRLGEVLDLVVGLTRCLSEDRGIQVDLEKSRISEEPLLIDRTIIIRILFCLLRSELESSQAGDRLTITVAKETSKFITIRIANPNHHIPVRYLSMPARADSASVDVLNRRNALWLATVLAEDLGGSVKVTSGREKGTNYTLLIPKNWISSIDRINRIQKQMEKSGKAARSELERVEHFASSNTMQAQSTLSRSMQSLYFKIRELEVLGNVSLLLADEFAADLGKEEEKLIKQDSGYLELLDAVLDLIRQIGASLQAGELFNSDVARLVSQCALAIGAELRLPREDQQSLHRAALLKDLCLSSAPTDELQRLECLTLIERVHVKEQLSSIRGALSRLDFLRSALLIVAHKDEKYDGSGYPDALRGKEIPLGARILAVAEAFVQLSRSLMSFGSEDAEAVAKELAADSGAHFDPRIIAALWRALRKGNVHIPGEQVKCW